MKTAQEGNGDDNEGGGKGKEGARRRSQPQALCANAGKECGKGNHGSAEGMQQMPTQLRSAHPTTIPNYNQQKNLPAKG